MNEKILEKVLQNLNLSKTLIYSSEYRLLYIISDLLSSFVTPPKTGWRKEVRDHLVKEVINLQKLDSHNMIEGYYPLTLPKPRDILGHIRNLPRIAVDSVKISRRRKLFKHRDFTRDAQALLQKVPDYLKRNYHFQTDGYLTAESAEKYDHQVEILFSGTAQAMRRMLIKDIKDHPGYDSTKPLRILEIGAGIGSATKDFARSFNIQEYYVTDISSPYLKTAQKRLWKNHKLHFITTPGEDLPFKDQSFDLIFSVFLFHEVPEEVRIKIMEETYRLLKPGGLAGVCDSLQMDDEPILNGVLENFPKDYHEPFYRNYTIKKLQKIFYEAKFTEVRENHYLLSKCVVGMKPLLLN